MVGNEAKVTISFPRGGEYGQRAEITIHDEISGATLSVRLSMENFAYLISGLARVAAEIDNERHIQNWGKQIERRSITVKSADWEDRATTAKAAQAENCPEGFTPNGFSHSQSGLVLHYAKWTEPEEAKPC